MESDGVQRNNAANDACIEMADIHVETGVQQTAEGVAKIPEIDGKWPRK